MAGFSGYPARADKLRAVTGDTGPHSVRKSRTTLVPYSRTS
jgi:hypothetical protein